jgi:hypothetical protein
MFVDRLPWEQVGRWLERLYVVLMLFGLTQGPVLQLWWTRAREAGVPVRPAIIATYIALQLPALFIFAYQRFSPRLLKGPLGLLVVLVVWLTASVGWATYSAHSIVEVMSLATTCIAGLYLAVRFSVVDKLILICVAMQVGVVWSYVAIDRGWSQAVGPFGEWIGIYYNRNSLAPVSAVGALTALALLWIVIAKRPWPWGPALAILLLDVIVFNGYVLLKTESETTLYAGVVAIVAWLLVSGFMALAQRRGATTPLTTAWRTGIALVVVAPWILVFGINSLGDFLDRFSIGGREGIWVLSYEGFLQKPVAGWGWMSAWETPNFLPRELWTWQQTIAGPWSHSSYFDVLLGGGLVAVALFVTFLVVTLDVHGRQVPNMAFGQAYTALAVFVLLAATQESFIIGNHFFMVLFVAGAFGPVFYQAVSDGVIAGQRTAG